MTLTNKFFCDLDFLRDITEDQLVVNGAPQTLSVTCCARKYELMILLEKDDEQNEFEVRVYKTEPAQKYVINNKDKMTQYGENEHFASFVFKNFTDAIEFLETLIERHPEYCARPLRIIQTLNN